MWSNGTTWSNSERASGITLLETIVALFLVAVAILGAAPMFVRAAQATDASGELGTVGALALDRMEQLRRTAFRDLDAGGSLTANVAGYFDDSVSFHVVRWRIEDLVSPSRTKRIVVFAAERGTRLGPRRQVALTSLRGL